MIFEYAMLVTVVGGVVLSLVYCGITGISPIPSSRISTRAILDALPDELTGTIYEPGAGWGSLAWPLAALYPDAQIVAFELNPVPWAFMLLRQAVFPRPNLTILRRDFLKANLADAAAVVCYLHPGALRRLAPQLEAQVEPGIPLVSNSFEVERWEPETVRQLEDSFCPTLYTYRVPAKAAEPAEP